MYTRRLVLGGVAALGLIIGGITIAQGPLERDINPTRQPNLATAQRLLDHAYGRITAAQQANEWDMDGHAAKAKELLDQASRELKAASQAHDRR